MDNVKNSGLGISSFVLSIIGVALLFLGLAVAMSVATATPFAGDEAYIGAGMTMILGGVASMVSLGLGWGACVQKSTAKVLPIIGLSLSGCVILFILLSALAA